MKNSLNNLPDGTIVYVDSNIFIYDATNHPKYAASCSIFLDRVESGEISGVTSVLSINETVHKLSIIATNDPDFERVNWLKVWKP